MHSISARLEGLDIAQESMGRDIEQLATEPLEGLRGPQGVQGIQGARGITGPRGLTGYTGRSVILVTTDATIHARFTRDLKQQIASGNLEGALSLLTDMGGRDFRRFRKAAARR